MSYGVGRRHSSDPALLWLWLWLWPAAAAPIQPLAWKLLYEASTALKKKNSLQSLDLKSFMYLVIVTIQLKR